jgi:predicted DsbA family dithiol-disulfide isomerase
MTARLIAMHVEVWSDIVCPWCYIGKRRFERALAGFDGASDVRVTWRSYQLNPSQPKGDTRTHDEYLALKTGRSLEDVRAGDARLTALAAAEGLDYHFERYRVANTFDAHRLLHRARAHGLGSEAHERFMRAQLVEGEPMEDAETLVRLAGEVGVPADAARAVLAGDAYAAEVREEIREAVALGCTGVPFFVIDRRYGISGAQPSELFLQVLERVQLDATAAGRP